MRKCPVWAGDSAEVCSVLLTSRSPALDEGYATCLELASQAKQWGLDPALVVSLAYYESKLSDHAVSHAGARGPLQVMPLMCRAWAQNGSPGAYGGNPTREGCDLVAAGLWTLQRWLEQSESRWMAICRYAAGWDCKEIDVAKRHANDVLSLEHEIERRIEQ